MKKRCCERIRSFVNQNRLIILGMLTVVILILLGLYFEIALAVAQLIFSASLAFTSFLLFRIQRAFNEHVRAFNEHVREKDDPDLVTVGDPECRIVGGTKDGKDVHKVEFTFRVCHPAPVFAALWKVYIENIELYDYRMSFKIQNWKIEKIDIDKRVLIRSQSYLPVLVKPNEITSVIFEATVDVGTRDEAKNITKLKWGFEYQIGDYKRKTKSYERNVTKKEQ